MTNYAEEERSFAQEVLSLVIYVITELIKVSLGWWWKSFRRHPFIWLFFIAFVLDRIG